jgi:hypothetical protein
MTDEERIGVAINVLTNLLRGDALDLSPQEAVTVGGTATAMVARTGGLDIGTYLRTVGASFEAACQGLEYRRLLGQIGTGELCLEDMIVAEMQRTGGEDPLACGFAVLERVLGPVPRG